MTYHQKIFRFTLRANINDFVRTKGHRMKLVPFNEDYVNCHNTKSNWRYDHCRFDAIQGTEAKAENKKP